MGHELVGRGHALQLVGGFLDLAVVLGPEHLQETVGGHTEESRAVLVGVKGPLVEDQGGLDLVVAALLDNRGMQWVALLRAH